MKHPVNPKQLKYVNNNIYINLIYKLFYILIIGNRKKIFRKNNSK